ncbi:hypothetical protein [Psychrosphaera algicola]|uniref:Uncharacterized protein n=1 Tax=Psychrosphaera algicola TaxID=3023714 RepID=A0ABT5FBS5_9GAMM|nr:hypothetical protein [Psychrosphaera sp. G1-22]MDC2888990.1 hypothetical protein [Psychrosphaera sp. G1-22]
MILLYIFRRYLFKIPAEMRGANVRAVRPPVPFAFLEWKSKKLTAEMRGANIRAVRPPVPFAFLEWKSKKLTDNPLRYRFFMPEI